MDDVEMVGVDQWADSAVILRCRFMVRPLEQWSVRREYLRRFEARLDELEREGWSLPVYRETILADVAETEF